MVFCKNIYWLSALALIASFRSRLFMRVSAPVNFCISVEFSGLRKLNLQAQRQISHASSCELRNVPITMYPTVHTNNAAAVFNAAAVVAIHRTSILVWAL